MSYATEVRKQLVAVCRYCGLTTTDTDMSGDEKDDDDPDYERLRRCLLVGFFDNVAHLQKDNFYLTLPSRQRAKIHPSSVLSGKQRPELIFYTEFLSTGQNYLKLNTVIDQRWLLDAPNSAKLCRNFIDK